MPIEEMMLYFIPYVFVIEDMADEMISIYND